MLRLLLQKQDQKKEWAATSRGGPSTRAAPTDSPDNGNALLKQYIGHERYGCIVADTARWPDEPGKQSLIQHAASAIDEYFALVPEGYASLTQSVNEYPGCSELEHQTDPFLLARYAVTNAQFQKFVSDGGYDQLDLWPEDIWPRLIDFKDLTDCSGPRFWREAHHDKQLPDHPVVGICQYEAAAYAKWAGYRLPTEMEWQMAASWRLRSSAQMLRRFPWGDAIDAAKCNIWTSGIGHTVPVDQFEEGAAPNGVLQLIGNVWEWTASDFNIVDDHGREIVGDTLMKSIRGGAFDTYFHAQATSLFRTALACLTRAVNVGFRCALGSKSSASPQKRKGETCNDNER